MALKIYGLPGSTCTARVLATIFEKNVDDFVIEPVNLATGAHKKPEFLKMQVCMKLSHLAPPFRHTYIRMWFESFRLLIVVFVVIFIKDILSFFCFLISSLARPLWWAWWMSSPLSFLTRECVNPYCSRLDRFQSYRMESWNSLVSTLHSRSSWNYCMFQPS